MSAWNEVLSERITPEEVGNFLMQSDRDWFVRLAQQMRADAQRLAEVERERDSLGDRITATCRQIVHLENELARLRPLAAEAEAWEKVKAHPMRAKDSFIVHDQDDGWSVSPLSGPRLSAPTAVALLERLDALVPKPEPGVWRWRFALDGNTSRQTFVSAEQALRWGRNQPHDGAPVRETVSPDGVVTLTPAPEGV